MISVELLTTLLIGINGLCFAYEMLVIGYVACQDRLTAARLKKMVLKNNNSNSSTKVLPMTNDANKSDGDNQSDGPGQKIVVKQSDLDDADTLKNWGK